MTRARRITTVGMLEFGAACLLYVTAVVGREPLLHVLHAGPSGMVRTLVLLLPVLPIWLVFLVVYRQYRRMDEFQRLQFLRSIAISFGIGFCLYASCPFLKDAGFISDQTANFMMPVMAIGWAAACAALALRNRPSPGSA